MGLTIRFQGGSRAGEILTFGDDIPEIAVGRNPDKCKICFPPNETTVGREHFALKRVLGKYRLMIPAGHLVSVNGKEAHDDQELPMSAELEVGPHGPKMIVETTGSAALLPTMDQGIRHAGTHTMLAETGQRAKKTQKVVAVVVLALIAIGVVLWFVKKNADEANENANKAGQTISAMLEKLPPKWRDISAKAIPSVYQVFFKRDGGGETEQGTAWVVKPGILATNCHVAADFPDQAANKLTMWVRSNANPPVDFKVTKVLMHPGKAKFEEMVGDYSPAKEKNSPSEAEFTVSLACDVGLLYVDDPDNKLAPPLPMASDAELLAMKPADEIAYIGYPVERMAGSILERPTPVVQHGTLVRMSDYLMHSDKPEANQLINHSMEMTGGASGSPILNDKGEVIALNNAMNPLVLNNIRFPLAVGVNFGQRVDLIRELLENTYPAKQEARDAQWKAELEEMDRLIPRLVESCKQDFMKDAGANAKLVQVLKRDVEVHTPIAAVDPGKFVYRFDIDIDANKAGQYLVIAAATKMRYFRVQLYEAGKQGNEYVDTNKQGRVASAEIKVDAARKLKCAVIGNNDHDAFTIYVFRRE